MGNPSIRSRKGVQHRALLYALGTYRHGDRSRNASQIAEELCEREYESSLQGCRFGPRSYLLVLELMLVMIMFFRILTFSLSRTTICSLKQTMSLSQKLAERKFY